MVAYCVPTVFLSAIPAWLGAVSVSWGWAVVVGLRGGLGLLAVGSGKGRGSGKRDGASQDGGRVLPHILLTTPWTLGVAENRPGAFCNPGLKSSEPHAGLSKISSFY